MTRKSSNVTSRFFLIACGCCASGSVGLGQNAADRSAAPPCVRATEKADSSQGLCTRLLREGRILGTTSVLIRLLLSQAVQEAARRLRGPECRRVLSDFTDASGRRLETNLFEFAVDPEDYVLDHVWFVDGSHEWQCRGSVAAFTQPGSRVIFVCGALFEGGNSLVPRAELMIIHEILHSLGLGENPPSSDKITRQVAARCGGTKPAHSLAAFFATRRRGSSRAEMTVLSHAPLLPPPSRSRHRGEAKKKPQ